MPAGKKQQSNAMLYTVITFVGLFIVTTTFAVIYYIKAEDYRTKAATAQSRLNELATTSQWNARGKIVGTIQKRQSYLGKMVDYLDEMVTLITGGPLEDTSAQVKVDTANRKVKDTLELLTQGRLDIKNATTEVPTQTYIDIETIDPNTTGLIRIIEKLKTKLDNITGAAAALQERLKQLQNRFDDAMTASFEKEQALLAEKERYHQQIKDIEKSYNELRALLKQTTERQVQTLVTQLDEEKTNRKQLRDELLKTRAELRMAENMMKRTLKELRAIKPPPDSEAMAVKPDGKIILLDEYAKTVHLNIGSDDHVYRGLTFSVYDKNMPIPKSGRGKAEIEVFDVEKNISAARIILSEIKRPIILGDIIANLIWDSDKTNVFVVAGEFDLDDNGTIDYDAVDKIKALIEGWGGRVADTVSIETDFLVLGKIPKVRQRPTFEELEINPMAMERHEASLQKLAHYKEVQTRTQALLIPIFNYERFLCFIGYKQQAGKTGAFW